MQLVRHDAYVNCLNSGLNTEHLVIRRVRISNGWKKVGFRMVGTIAVIDVYSNPDHSYSSPDLQNVRFFNESGFQRVGFRIPTVGIARPLDNNTI